MSHRTSAHAFGSSRPAAHATSSQEKGHALLNPVYEGKADLLELEPNFRLVGQSVIEKAGKVVVELPAWNDVSGSGH